METMLIYNITIRINWDIQSAWLKWMQEAAIADIMKTGCFVKHQFVRLLEIDEGEGPTYALQLYADSHENYNRYADKYLPRNDRVNYEKWGNDVLCFSTLMEVIS